MLWAQQASGGFRGQMEATAPLHDENLALAPPFWQEWRPLTRPNAVFLSVFCSEFGGNIQTKVFFSRKTRQFFRKKA